MGEFKNAVMNFIRLFFSQVNTTLNMGSRAITTTAYNIQDAASTYAGDTALTITRRTATNNPSWLTLMPAGSPVAGGSLDILSDSTANASILTISIVGGIQANITSDRLSGAGTYLPIRIQTSGGSQQWSYNIDGTYTMPDPGNLILGTTTGTKIGTAGSQKLAFYNATPIVQQTGVAVTAAAIHAALVNLGLITA